MRGLSSYKTRFNPYNSTTEMQQVRNMTVVFHSFDVFALLILPFYKGLSVFNFPWCLVLLLNLIFR